MHLEAERTCVALHVACFVNRRRITRVKDDAEHGGFWSELAQEFQPFSSDLGDEQRDAGHVAAGPAKAFHKSELHRIATDREHDRDR